jgi:hypothetical protein
MRMGGGFYDLEKYEGSRGPSWGTGAVLRLDVGRSLARVALRCRVAGIRKAVPPDPRVTGGRRTSK